MEINRRIKIITALGISFFMVGLLSKIFLANTPRINKTFIASLLLKNTPTPTITPILKSNVKINTYTINNPTPTVITPTTTAKPVPTVTLIPSTVRPSQKPSQVPPTPTTILPTGRPFITSSPIDCPSTSSETYDPFRVNSQPSDPPAAIHPDININVRGYVSATGPLQLLDIDGPTDDKSPRLTSFVKNNPNPKFIKLYRVYDWNWNKNSRGSLISDPPASMFGMEVRPNDIIRVPNSQYDMGGGYQALVIYATANSITFKYTPDDNVVIGYAIHVENFCVDANLLALYNQLDADGRSQLPGLRGMQTIGYARTNEIRIVIRDSGAFMDARSKKDWW